MSTATLFDTFKPGDVFMKAHRMDPSHPMALYRFDGWNTAPASSIGGRLADATWLFNGTRSGAWERDMIAVADGNADTHSDVWVCEDCYFAHHYGYTEVNREPTADELHAWKGGYLRGHDLPNIVHTGQRLQVREWFAGDTDTPASCEPLTMLADCDLADNVDSDTGDGMQDFSWSSCDGCGSTPGGSRSRLAVSVSR